MPSNEPRDPRPHEPAQTEFEFPATRLRGHSDRRRLRRPGATLRGEGFPPTRADARGPASPRRVRVRAPLSPRSRRLEIAREAFEPTPWQDRSWGQDIVLAAAPSELARHAGLAEFAITLLATLAFGLGWAAFELGDQGWAYATPRGGGEGSVYAGGARGAIGAPTRPNPSWVPSSISSPTLDAPPRFDGDSNRRETIQWTSKEATAQRPTSIGKQWIGSDFGRADAKSKP